MQKSAARIYPAFLLACLSACATLRQGGFADTESEPLTENYKKFREKHRQLYIQNFDNRTYSPQLTGRLKDKLQFAFTRRQSFTVTPEKKQADLILYGKILQYSEEPGVFDRSAAPLTYNITIVASMRLRVRSVAEDAEAPYEQHTVKYTTTYSVGDPLYETRYTAEERMLEGLADRLVNATYEPENMDVQGLPGTRGASKGKPENTEARDSKK